MRFFLRKVYLFFCFLLLLGSADTFAQTENNGVVSGKLIDAINGEQIDFAGVAIIIPENESIIKNTITNNGGEFKLTNLPYGKYNVRISYIGYEKVLISDIEINAGHPDHALGVIHLKRSGTALNEVT